MGPSFGFLTITNEDWGAVDADSCTRKGCLSYRVGYDFRMLSPHSCVGSPPEIVKRLLTLGGMVWVGLGWFSSLFWALRVAPL